MANKQAKGRPPVPDDVRGLKLLNQRDVELIFNRLMNLSARELEQFTMNPSNPAKEIMIGRLIIETINRGDASRFEIIMNRLLGKPKETVEHEIKLSYHNEIMHMIREKEEQNLLDVTPAKDQ